MYEFLTSPAVIEYMSTYGMWGITGPVLAVFSPAIVWALIRS